MTNTNSPLHGLLIDEEQISKHADELLAKVLTPYIMIVKSSHEVQLSSEGTSLKNSSKVLVTLGAHLVLKRLGLVEDESLSQKQLIEILQGEGVAEGSVKSALSYLRKEKLVSKTPKSRYFIGLDKLSKLKAELEVSDE